MTDSLVVCAGCYRHLRATERACPFCRAALDAPPPASRPGALHTAVIAAALALAASDRAHAQQGQSQGPRFDMMHGGAEGYGAPPHPMPMPTMEHPVEQQMPHERGPVVFELARGPMGRRPTRDGQWTDELVIHADGSWSAPGRRGRLTDVQMRVLRATIAHVQFRLVRVRGPQCTALSTHQERVTAGASSVSWSTPCGTTPDPSVTRLVATAHRLTGA